MLLRRGPERERLVQQVKTDVIDVFVAVAAEHSDTDVARRIEADEAAIAARPSVVPHDLPRRPQEDVPGEADLEVWIIGRMPLAMRLLQGARERCRCRIEV